MNTAAEITITVGCHRYIVTTALALKGRGIDSLPSRNGKNIYMVTDKALEGLKAKYTSYETSYSDF